MTGGEAYRDRSRYQSLDRMRRYMPRAAVAGAGVTTFGVRDTLLWD